MRDIRAFRGAGWLIVWPCAFALGISLKSWVREMLLVTAKMRRRKMSKGSDVCVFKVSWVFGLGEAAVGSFRDKLTFLVDGMYLPFCVVPETPEFCRRLVWSSSEERADKQSAAAAGWRALG